MKLPLKQIITSIFIIGLSFCSCSEKSPEESRSWWDERLMTDPVWKNLTEQLHKQEEPFMAIEIFAQQFRWEARYPGSDGKLAKSDYKLIDSTNVVGIDYTDPASADDFIADEIHLPVNKKIRFEFRSKDVIHSAYFPHFRAQMNCVPGMKTTLEITPKMTTEQMRKEQNKPEFEYMLLCNKICGASHFNMQKKVVVEEEGKFLLWAAKKEILNYGKVRVD